MSIDDWDDNGNDCGDDVDGDWDDDGNDVDEMRVTLMSSGVELKAKTDKADAIMLMMRC